MSCKTCLGGSALEERPAGLSGSKHQGLQSHVVGLKAGKLWPGTTLPTASRAEWSCGEVSMVLQDPRKLARGMQLLQMNEEIKTAKKVSSEHCGHLQANPSTFQTVFAK